MVAWNYWNGPRQALETMHRQPVCRRLEINGSPLRGLGRHAVSLSADGCRKDHDSGYHVTYSVAAMGA